MANERVDVERTAELKDECEDAVVDLTPHEQYEVEDKVPTRAPVIFEIVRRMGEEELNRPLSALWWSGLAAGLAMGFSILTEAILKTELGGFKGSILIEKLGYTVGFLLVIASRQQLFTESTLTSVVPLLSHFHVVNAKKLVRLWAVVFCAKPRRTTCFALFLAKASVIDADVLNQAVSLSLLAVQRAPLELIVRGVAAGFLIATLVWILANIQTGQFFAITVITYLIGLGKFAHIIAGSVEGALVVITGHVGLFSVVFGFIVPTLIGNIIGGTGLFALITYGQLREELNEKSS